MSLTLATDPWTGHVDRAMELLELIAGDVEAVRWILLTGLGVACMFAGAVIFGHLFSRRVTDRHLGGDKGPG